MPTSAMSREETERRSDARSLCLRDPMPLQARDCLLQSYARRPHHCPPWWTENANSLLFPVPKDGPKRRYPAPQYTLSPATAGPARTELPAAYDHSTFPVEAFRANIVGFAGLVSIDPANTTPLATLAGESAKQPCSTRESMLNMRPALRSARRTPR